MSIAENAQKVGPKGEPEGFVTRKPACSRYEQAGIERRQFPNIGVSLSADGQELERAIDLFKLANGKQRINVDEIISVMRSLGYAKLER